jgi:carbonic anhydrase
VAGLDDSRRVHMDTKLVVAITGIAVAAWGPAARAEDTPHWGYEGEAGPARWGELSPKFATCGTGRSQSPIDIVTKGTVSAGHEKREHAYKPAKLTVVHLEHQTDVVNTGHSIQVNYPGGSALSVGDKGFELLQYHFHAPSEHTVNGKSFPMEMHLVHRSAGGELAVVGVFLTEGKKAHPAFAPIVANLPKAKGDEVLTKDLAVDARTLLPRSKHAYRYAGSLTTPPCTEGVSWIVMQAPVELSKDQIAAFSGRLHGNNRPPQPLNGREVMADEIARKSKE